MKLMFASDIHGDIARAKQVFEIYEREGAQKLILLGDLLYFGPRNTLTDGYNPQAVIKLLNENKEKLLCVRGNCDAEVDQMVLPFPILAEYAHFVWDGVRVFATHGHHHNPENLPPMLKKGDVFLYGHTHLYEARRDKKGILLLNPGSVSLPKGGNEKTYMIYEDHRFSILTLDGDETIATRSV